MFGASLYHVTRGQIVNRNDASARLPRRKQLVLAIIETQRHNRERHIICGEPQILGYADCAQRQVGVAEHDAFGTAGGPASVEDGGQRVCVCGNGERWEGFGGVVFEDG